MAAPLIAAGIMAGASLLGAGIQSYSQSKAAEAEREAREQAAKQLRAQGQLTDNEYRQVIDSINAYYAQRKGISNAGDVDAYRNALATELGKPEDYYAADVGDFSKEYTKTKEDFINPYYSRIIGDTANTIQHSAAGAGLGRGTGAALNIAKGTAEKSDELYRTAMQDYQQDRNFAYQQFTDAIRNNQARLDAIRENNQYKLGLQGNLAQDYVNTQDARQSDLLKAQQDRLASKQAYDTAIVRTLLIGGNMAGIYTRDNVNYSQMLQNAIANRARNAERQAQYIQNQGKLWGDTVANVGSIIGRGVGGYNSWAGDTTEAEAEDAELELLKKQVEEYEAQQAEAADYNGQVQTATNLMEGYHPNVVGTYSRASLYDDNPYKLPGNSNANQSDYFNYQMAMNRLYGGR